ncbi:uncharacterized protein BO97DRAFT_419723 [Aspergillus homomorphus CBS 101889]|uniref:Uncharacterized protein n=1 Tax=Aspergillus homomorphus (strain CBS 101889) TaxID=1450537 RepID=A0A395IH02_ASPHC|nr:hypothetical protein BO97DRAFT_419723 [Aspergillus homomorphus CBS 101889]RAL17484.1 hypothetical protein BO97DRAFT_419723 [Aspergillus homomorphus CBS 101889]
MSLQDASSYSSPLLLRDVPIHPRVFFCMHRLRTSSKDYDPMHLESFKPRCVHDVVASVACQQCSKRNRTCKKATIGILGPRNNTRTYRVMGLLRFGSLESPSPRRINDIECLQKVRHRVKLQHTAFFAGRTQPVDHFWLSDHEAQIRREADIRRILARPPLRGGLHALLEQHFSLPAPFTRHDLLLTVDDNGEWTVLIRLIRLLDNSRECARERGSAADAYTEIPAMLAIVLDTLEWLIRNLPGPFNA